MRKILFLTLVISLAACKSRKPVSSSEKYELENLAHVISKGDLQKTFPDAQIAEGVDLFEEGTVERAYTLLYPDTKDELLLMYTVLAGITAAR
jgi:HAMP domain-containing protein